MVLSVPVALVMNMTYCRFLAKVARRLDRVPVCGDRRVRYQRLLSRIVRWFVRLRRSLYSVSLMVLGLFFAELVLLAKLGPVHSRAVVGPGFFVAHSVVFFLGPPALANALILGGCCPLVARWYVAGAICTIYALFLYLMGIGVGEALYGIDGRGGPYS
jgi:hypothetical protein